MAIIDKINVGGNDYSIKASQYVGTCAIAANTAAKTVTCADFPGNAAGEEIIVTFTYATTASSPTLNVNGKGALPIYANGKALDYSWSAGAVVSFICDGDHWCVQSDARVISSGAAGSKPASGVKGQIYFVV